MSLELVPPCLATLQVGEMRHIDTPTGRRLIGEIDSSTWVGERISATQVGSGTDWLSYHDDELATIDVRLTLRTDDDATVLVTYRGRSDLRAGHATTSLLFETGDERYGWLNRTLAAGRGAFDRATNAMRYEIFELR